MFRHSFWQQRRLATWRALSVAGVSKGRLARFGTCGSAAWVMECKTDSSIHRVVCSRCRDRFCEACASERRRLVANNLYRWLDKRFPVARSHKARIPVRFVTLTLKATDSPLSATLDRLQKCWCRLRRRKLFASSQKGGLCFLEVKRGKNSGYWHPHLHALVEGDYLSQKQLSRAWHEITGDSFVVHIEAIADAGKAAQYVTKYASKALDSSVWQDQDDLVIAIHALAGRRVFATFGSWSGLDLSKNPEDGLEWFAVISLAKLITAASNGDADASSLLRSLKERCFYGSGDISHTQRGSPEMPSLS